MRALWVLGLAATLGAGCRCDPREKPTPTRQALRTMSRPVAPRVPSTPATATAALKPPPPRDAPRAASGSTAITPARPRPTARTTPTARRTAPRPTHPGFRLRSGRLDIDVHRADVRQLLESLAQATGTNIVLRAEVQGRVTVQLRNQPLHAAVEVVASAVGCRVRPSGRMLIIQCP